MLSISEGPLRFHSTCSMHTGDSCSMHDMVIIVSWDSRSMYDGVGLACVTHGGSCFVEIVGHA